MAYFFDDFDDGERLWCCDIELPDFVVVEDSAHLGGCWLDEGDESLNIVAVGVVHEAVGEGLEL